MIVRDETVLKSVEAIQTISKFLDGRTISQFAHISCDIGLLNNGLIAMREALDMIREDVEANDGNTL